MFDIPDGMLAKYLHTCNILTKYIRVMRCLINTQKHIFEKIVPNNKKLFGRQLMGFHRPLTLKCKIKLTEV